MDTKKKGRKKGTQEVNAIRKSSQCIPRRGLREPTAGVVLQLDRAQLPP